MEPWDRKWNLMKSVFNYQSETATCVIWKERYWWKDLFLFGLALHLTRDHTDVFFKHLHGFLWLDLGVEEVWSNTRDHFNTMKSKEEWVFENSTPQTKNKKSDSVEWWMRGPLSNYPVFVVWVKAYNTILVFLSFRTVLHIFIHLLLLRNNLTNKLYYSCSPNEEENILNLFDEMHLSFYFLSEWIAV